MPTLLDCDAWVLRVLGVPVPRPAPPREPFQVFVKSADGVTLTLTLPNGPQTTLGDLRDLVERRSGLSLDEHVLMIGTKPFNQGHAGLPVAEYGVQRNQTLVLNGALKGGWGERAVMVDTLMQQLVQGNVMESAQSTKGMSTAKVGYNRDLLGRNPQRAKKFRDGLFQRLNTIGALPSGVTSADDLNPWIADKKMFLAATLATTTKAGNCGEYSDYVFTSLVSNTQGQFVYRLEMGKPYDHVFTVTCPNNHGTNLKDLYDDAEAMALDAWWEGRIDSFKRYTDGANYYQEAIDLKYMRIATSQPTTGAPPWTEQVHKQIVELVADLHQQDAKAIEQSAAYHGGRVAKIDNLTKRVELWGQQVQALKDKISKNDPPMSEKELNELRGDLLDVVNILRSDKLLLEEAKNDTKDMFGVSGEAWDREQVGEARAAEELFGSFDTAFAKGGIAQLEIAMGEVMVDEFFDYCLGDDKRIRAVFRSKQLAEKFQAFGKEVSQQAFSEFCQLMTKQEFEDYVLTDEELTKKYKTGLEEGEEKVPVFGEVENK